METGIMSEVWRILLTVVITAVGTYVGAIHKLKTKVEVLEHRVLKAEQRLDRKSTQFDKLQADLADIKADFAEVKGDLKAICETMNYIKSSKS